MRCLAYLDFSDFLASFELSLGVVEGEPDAGVVAGLLPESVALVVGGADASGAFSLATGVAVGFAFLLALESFFDELSVVFGDAGAVVLFSSASAGAQKIKETRVKLNRKERMFTPIAVLLCAFNVTCHSFEFLSDSANSVLLFADIYKTGIFVDSSNSLELELF